MSTPLPIANNLFLIPISLESLYAVNSANEVAQRRYLYSADDSILKAKGVTTARPRAELETNNAVTQSLRDHALAALTPTVVRLGFLITHLFNIRYCQVVSALHQGAPQSAPRSTITSPSDKGKAFRDVDGPAAQETCETSAGWLEDLQACVDAVASPSNVKKEEGQPGDDEEAVQKFITFGPNSWFRMLPAGLNLAGKTHRVMIRRHVMRFCILDNLQRVAGTDVVVPAPCAWEVQLQSYEIAMTEMLASQRLADRSLPEGYLRLLLWQLQNIAADGEAAPVTCGRRQLTVAATSTGFTFPVGALVSQAPTTATQQPAPSTSSCKLSPALREHIQSGALALLSFCYRSTDLLLFGSKCIAVRGPSNKWAAASQKGSFSAGILGRATGRGATYDVAVMCFAAATSHSLQHGFGGSAASSAAVRRELWRSVFTEGASKSALEAEDDMPNAVDAEAVPLTVEQLEAYFVNFMALLSRAAATEPLRRDPPASLDYLQRVCRIVS